MLGGKEESMKRTHALIALLLGSAAVAPVAVAHTTHYVDNVRTCAGLVPCHPTIMHAVNAAVSFNSIRVFPGVYHESVVFDISKSDIVLQAHFPWQPPVIVAPPGNPAVVLGSDRLHVLGLVIEGEVVDTPSFGRTGLVVEDNFITGGGISLFRVHDGAIRRNTISRAGTGILLTSPHNSLVEANVVSDVDGNGISLVKTAVQPTSNVIRANRVRSAGGNGIFMIFDAHGNTIEDNDVSGSGMDGIFVAADGIPEASSNNLVRRNTSVENGGCDINEPFTPSAPPGAIWRNNRFVTSCGVATK